MKEVHQRIINEYREYKDKFNRNLFIENLFDEQNYGNDPTRELRNSEFEIFPEPEYDDSFLFIPEFEQLDQKIDEKREDILKNEKGRVLRLKKDYEFIIEDQRREFERIKNENERKKELDNSGKIY